MKKIIIVSLILLLNSCVNNGGSFRHDQHTVQPGETVYFIAWKYKQDPQKIIQWNQLDDTAKIYPDQKLWISRPPNYTDNSYSPPPPQNNIKPVYNPASSTQNKNPVYVDNKLRLPVGSGASNNEATEEPIAYKEHSTENPAPKTSKQKAPFPVPNKRIGITTPQPKKSATKTSAMSKIWGWPHKGKVVKKFSISKVNARGIGITGTANNKILAANSGTVVYSGDGIKNYGNLIIIKHNKTFLSAYAHNKIIKVKEGQAVNKGQVISTMGPKKPYNGYLHFEIRKLGTPVNPLIYLPK